MGIEVLDSCLRGDEELIDGSPGTVNAELLSFFEGLKR